MANDLMPVGGDQLALPSEPVTPTLLFGRKKPVGLEEFSYRELGLEPQLLQIVHAIRTKQDIGHPGDYRLGQQAFTDPLVVFLRGHHIRTLLEGPTDRPRTVCASSDGLDPHNEVPDPKAEHCGTCAYGVWRTLADGKRQPPPCQPGVALLGLMVETGEPFWFLCRKTALKPVQAFGREVGGRAVPYMSRLLVQLKTEENKSDTGGVIWYTPVFSIVTTNGTEVYDQVADFVQEARYVPPATAAAAAPSPEADNQTWEVPV
jgi:hypothetical protein